MLTPEQTAAFDQATGWKTPTAPPPTQTATGGAPVQSRADEIRALGKSSTPQEPSYFQRVGSDISGAAQEAGQAQINAQEGKVNPFAAGATIFKDVTKAAVSPIAQAVGPAVGKAIQPINPIINAVADKISDSKAVQDFANFLDTPSGKAVSDTLEGAFNLSGMVGGNEEVIPKVKGAMKDIVGESPPPGGGGGGSGIKGMVGNAVKGAQEKAVIGLQSDYEKYLGATKTGVKKLGKAESKTEALNRAGTTGKPPQQVLAEAHIIPKTEGTMFRTAEQAQAFREGTAPLNDALGSALKEVTQATEPVLTDTLEQDALARVGAKTMTEGERADLQAGIQNEFALLKSKYGASMTALDMQEAKSPYWGKTKFNALKPFQNDVNYQIAKSFQKGIEDVATKAGFEDVAQLNREIGDRLDAANTLQSLDGQTLKYGRLGKYVFMGIGASLGHGIVGKILGAAGGEMLGQLLIDTSVAGPVKRLLLKNLEVKSPEAYQATLDWIKKQGLEKELRLALPEPAYTPLGAPKVPDASGVESVPAEKYPTSANPKSGKFQTMYKSGQSLPSDLETNATSKNANTDSSSSIPENIPPGSPKGEGGVPSTPEIEKPSPEGYNVPHAGTPEANAESSRGGGDVVRPASSDARPQGEGRQVDYVAKGANAYNKSRGLSPIDHSIKVEHSEALARKIADAYDALKVDNSADPKVAKAYKALRTEIKQQWDFIEKNLGIKMEPWKQEGQPYANSKEMQADVENNKHLYFFTGGEPHSFFDKVDSSTGYTSNEMLRAVHDVFGHAAGGNNFGFRGEENAWNLHSKMFSPEAIKALTTETRGQNSWVNFNKANYDESGVHTNRPLRDRPYAVQKVDILPDTFTTPAPKLTGKISLASTATNKVTPRQTEVANGLSPEEKSAYIAHRNSTLKVFPEFQALYSDIKEGMNLPESKFPPATKSDARAIEKAVDDYTTDGKTDFSQVKDMIRGGFIVKDLAQLKELTTKITGKVPEGSLIKNSILHPTEVGYRDIKVNPKMSNGTYGEFQVMFPEMEATKDVLHPTYEIARPLVSKDLRGEALSPSEIRTLDGANAKMTKAYTDTWAKVKSKYGLNDATGQELENILRGGKETPKPPATSEFKGLKDLSTKLLEKLKGRTTVSRQFIEDLTNSPDLKQPERDLIRRVLGESSDSSPLAQEAQKYSSADWDTLYQRDGNSFAPRGSVMKTEASVLNEHGVPEPISNAQVDWNNKGTETARKNLLARFATPNGQKVLNEIIDKLPKNADGTITAYRTGKIGGDLPQSYTLSKGMAKTFSNQGTDVPKFGFGLKSEYSKVGDLGSTEVRIKPENIRAYSPYDAEILVEPKGVLTDFYNKVKGGSQISVPDFANKVKTEALLPFGASQEQKK